MAFSFKAIGLSKLGSNFKRFRKKVVNKRVMFERIGINILNEIDNNFKTESNAGDKWAELSPVTLDLRRNKTSFKILQDTGNLKNSFVSKATNINVRVGTPVEYASKHEFGKGRIPQRKMLPTDERALKIAIKSAHSYLKVSQKESGL